MFEINLSLDNKELYSGCKISMVGGKYNLETDPNEAANIVGINLLKIIKQAEDNEEVLLTGAMAVWVYLVVFHGVVHRFKKVWYQDGFGNKILIAAHG